MQTVFIDRDGVINHDSPEYIKSPSEFEFIPGSLEALRLLAENDFQVIVITNQSAVGRGMITLKTLEAIFDKMRSGIEADGGALTDIFFCPHRPDEGCDCRKPKPGMILAAAAKYNIDLEKSCMIGDSAKDIESGKRAGCRHTLLVRTGNGNKAETALTQKKIRPDYIGDDLLDAVRWIIQNSPKT